MALVAHPPSRALIDLVRTLGGSWSGYKAMCRCPAHADSTPSLSLRQGREAILVHCFAGCPPKAVLAVLGQIAPTAHQAPETRAPPYDGATLVARLWREGRAIGGTLAEAYLAGRGLAGPLADLRYHPRCPRGPSPHTVFAPALLVGLRAQAGIVAVQRLFLDPSGRCTAKMLLGRPRDAAWRGAPASHVLVLAEGFETAAAFTQIHSLPCWAALGGERFTQLALPSQVRHLILAQDNDPAGARLARRACAHFAALGFAVQRWPPPPDYGDWADRLGAPC